MRKKYLSALLFGALLFASTGTFTSCKDYDDDINNLQTQIDQVAKNLDDLKAKVDALGGWVENVSFADGVLSVTTGGKTVTYPIPDKGVNNVTLALDGNNLVLDVDGTKQTIALPEAETPEIPEIKVEDGILYVGDKEYPLTVDVDNNVTIVESTIPGNETYTVMINGEEVTFPKAFADVRISLVNSNNGDDFYFTDAKFANEDVSYGTPSGKQENGIHWTILSQDVKWDGPKGDLKAGLVVGQVTAAEVSVRPINYDLTTAELTLVSSKGEVAPVTVIATKGQKEGPLSNGTRSADVNYSGVDQGDYVLSLVFDKFTAGKEAEEIISKFANAAQTGNIKYALAVDGVVATDYNFIIDTQLKADAQSSCETPDGSKLVIGGEGKWDRINEVLTNVPANDLFHRMTYLDGRVYDMKVAINAKDVNDAEVYGVEISQDGTSIKAGQNAIGRTFALDVTLIDVNGNISATKTIEIQFAEAQQQEVTLSPVTYNVTPAADKSVLVDLGDVFSSLTAGDAIAINSLSNITWAIENEDPTFLWYYDNGILGVQNNEFDYLNYGRVSTDATGYNRIMYYDENMNGIDVSDDKMDENVKKIRYARLVWNGVDYANPRATDGEHLISITINRNISASDTDSGNRLVKKVNIPVHVVVPAWEDLFKTTSQWNGNTYITRLTNVDASLGEAFISMDAFQDASTAWGNNLNDAISITELKYATPDGREDDAFTGSLPAQVGGAFARLVTLDYNKLTDDIANTHKLAFTTMSAKAEYVIGGVADFTIEKEFNVQLKTIFEDAKLVYYVSNGSAWVAAANAKMNASDIIVKGTVDSDNETITAEGLVLELNGYKHRIASAFFDGTRSIALKANNITGGEFDIKYSNSLSNESDINIWKLDAQAGGLNVNVDRAEQDGVKVTSATSIDSGTSGSVTLYFEDIMGVQTEATINFVKE